MSRVVRRGRRRSGKYFQIGPQRVQKENRGEGAENKGFGGTGEEPPLSRGLWGVKKQKDEGCRDQEGKAFLRKGKIRENKLGKRKKGPIQIRKGFGTKSGWLKSTKFRGENKKKRNPKRGLRKKIIMKIENLGQPAFRGVGGQADSSSRVRLTKWGVSKTE